MVGLFSTVSAGFGQPTRDVGEPDERPQGVTTTSRPTGHGEQTVLPMPVLPEPRSRAARRGGRLGQM